MISKLYTFGYKHVSHHVPLFDVPYKMVDVRRYITDNPYNVSDLRLQSGLDQAVKEYFQSRPHVTAALTKIVDDIGTHNGVVYLGCTGGRHRSVYVGEVLSLFYGCPVEHLDIDKG